MLKNDVADLNQGHKDEAEGHIKNLKLIGFLFSMIFKFSNPVYT